MSILNRIKWWWHQVFIASVKVISVALIVSSCALPMPLSYLNYGRMAYDTNQIIQDEATTVDVALSMATDRECRTINILDDKDICEKTPLQELKEYLVILGLA